MMTIQQKHNKKYVITYLTTNLINGKKYFGVHGTNDINDDYIGSGRVMKRAIKKYGKENFKREIDQIFTNYDDAFQREAEVVTEDWVKDNNTYNLFLGGYGQGVWSEESRRKMSEACKKVKKTPEWNRKNSEALKGRIMSKDWKENMSKAQKKRFKTDSPKNKGKIYGTHIFRITTDKGEEFIVEYGLCNFQKDYFGVDIKSHNIFRRFIDKGKIPPPRDSNCSIYRELITGWEIEKLGKKDIIRVTL